MNNMEITARIGELSEMSLHASFKQLLSKEGDRREVRINGKIVDILRANGEIVEIQTGNFSKLRSKLPLLTQSHQVRVVYPIVLLKTIVHIDPRSGLELSRRKSPKRGSFFSLFEELVYYPELCSLERLILELPLVEVEELRSPDGQGSWRRKFISILDRRLTSCRESRVFSHPNDLLSLLPPGLEGGFTVSDLARAGGMSRSLAGKMAYVLKKNLLTSSQGRQGREIFYRLGSQP